MPIMRRMLTTRHMIPIVSRTYTALLVAGLFASLTIAGCETMHTIDRRIEKALVSGSNAIDGDSIAPKMREPVAKSYEAPGMYEKQPESTNPPAEDLIYKLQQARSVEEVLARLDEYTKERPDPLRISLRDAWRITQESARDYITAEEDYILAAIRLLIERHRWGPRFFDDVIVAADYDLGDGNDTAAFNVINDLRVTQLLPYGGDVEARLITTATQQLTGVVGDQFGSATELALTANIPLLRDAGLIAQEDLIQAERDLIYAARDFENFRREFFVRVARDYFDLIAQQESIKNQERTLESRRQNALRQAALVRDGRSAPSEAALAEQDVLSQQNTLNDSRDRLIIAKDQFKLLLGLPMDRDIILEPITLELIEPDISLDDAVELTLTYRLEYQTERDQVADSRRNVENARNQTLPDLDVNLVAAFGTDDDDKADLLTFDLDDSRYASSVTFGLPLDREIERLNLRSAVIGYQRQVRSLEQLRDQLILDARAAVRAVDTARNALNLQERSVALNERRIREFEAKRDQIDAQRQIDAENDLLRSLNDRDNALRDLRTRILEYLLVTGQLRVAPDGAFKPLPGMVIQPIPDQPAADLDPAKPEEILPDPAPQ